MTLERLALLISRGPFKCKDTCIYMTRRTKPDMDDPRCYCANLAKQLLPELQR